MKIRFWGVRGSIAVPGPATVRYGGNTTCIEVRGDDDELIILDAGTGIFQLAQHLLGELPIQAHIFNTHTHWDHIQGLPFFVPFFIPDNRIQIYGAIDPVTQRDISEILTAQLQYRFFPIREAELKAEIGYATLKDGQSVQVGSVRITAVMLNHPVINFGYRVDCNGKSLFFTGDYEPPTNIYQEEEPEYADYQQIIDEKNAAVAAAMDGVDVLIADAAYTRGEYAAKKGWGHGTFDSCIELARRCGAKRLLCTHHEPTRSDAELEEVFASVMQQHPNLGFDVELAYETMEIKW